ncbi:hypothetical protein [Cyanothece sp. BG0011]|uniref:hypothetical protein n=1 Tax=Cyanothece sp. BG0011 TaxID=2082950 RepID=UPI000D1D71E2|nr:hypothetical protein [Cyanothece sp. BG0011]
MKVIPSILITFSLISMAPKAVSQVLRSSDFDSLATTSSEDLTGVEPRNIDNWNWGLGGEFPEREPSPSLESSNFDLDLYETRVRQLNDAYQDTDYNFGDYDRPTRRFPLVDL